MAGLKSNWSTTIDALVFHVPDAEPLADDSPDDSVPHAHRTTYVSLQEAAVALGHPTTQPTWRRKIVRRLRALEREHGVDLLVNRKGRHGTTVRVDALCQVCPLPIAGLAVLRGIHARVVSVEARLAALEDASRKPQSAKRAESVRK